ncbi:hypothetical protein BDR04DRAFT_1110046 [Suillus decipiens]|nr:hypothetical protein BDR04DRAFT_1110046 [Suillus decipiens]
MSQQALLDLSNIDWSKLWITILAFSIYALTEVNNWSIKHPYVAAGALMCISAEPDILLTPLRLAGKTTLYICLLPFRLILWTLKFLTSVSGLSVIGAVFILGRTWGWWS